MFEVTIVLMKYQCVVYKNLVDNSNIILEQLPQRSNTTHFDRISDD